MRRKTKQLLDEYDKDYQSFQTLNGIVKKLIQDILMSKGITVHTISGRVKDKESLQRKIESKPPKHYTCIEDITDIVGARVTVYFAEDVDKIAQAIESEFDIDTANSVDKGALLDPDKFGYLSLHYIASLNDMRTVLPEYKFLKGYKVEIQIRSILQHAWAEIEHDLGYKSSIGIPKSIRRRFSRLAGLLELADEEFIGIRKDLSIYEIEVKENIDSTPQSIGIDSVSLKSFITGNRLVKEIDASIHTATGIPINVNIDELDMDIYSDYVPKLNFLGLSNIAELESLLNSTQKLIPEFAREWIRSSRITNGHDPDLSEEDMFLNEGFGQGISIFYSFYVYLAKLGDMDIAADYFRKMVDEGSEEKVSDHIVQLLEVYEKLRKGGNVTVSKRLKR